MSDDALETVLAAVERRVTPEDEERERMRAAASDLVERAEAALADLPVEGDVLRVGSTARGTWVAGDRDIDVFVRFPPEIPRADLEEYGLTVGRSVLPEGREEYAEHPYVTGTYQGFDVDLVPCYAVEDATEIESAVDRTPFHTRWLDAHLDDELAADVRVAKAFLKGIGAYGSDLRTEGFGGYLTELLVWEHGGFAPLLRAAADWSPPVRFDPEDHGTATFDDPLVVIDPTDPERNVAAVLSARNLARVQHHARRLLDDPDEAAFERTSPEPLSAGAVREHVRRRGTTPLALRFDAPDAVEDQLYPQLRRSLGGLVDELDRRGFDVLRSAAWADESAVLLIELAVAELPAIERHEGPPVAVRAHAEGFHDKYADDPDAYGPFVDGGRYVVERERASRTAAGLVESDAVFDVGLGPAVEHELETGYEVLVGEDVADLAAEFGVELAAHFEPRP
jgi:tRNA nucleotidyltransferase (CCA-adding enzyme)